MLPCDRYQDRLLEHLYGLLDPADSEVLESHLAGCPGCSAAREQAARWGGLIARAAKAEFPDVRFIPPESAAAPAGGGGGATTGPFPAAGPTNTVRRTGAWWAVAASLLLGVVGLGGWTARDAAGYFYFKPRVDREVAELRRLEAERTRLAEAVREAHEQAARQLNAARERHDELINRWKDAEGHMVTAARERRLSILLSGPATAVPGAPNEYAVRINDREGMPRPATVVAQVKDSTGRTLFQTSIVTDGTAGLKPNEQREPRKDLTLPASLWADVPPGAELFLELSATDRETGDRAELIEKVRLLTPVYTTFLTTDKPMYRPGEIVYFRSLTLDRASFLPPERELNLRFELKGPNGQPVPGLMTVGLAKPAARRSPSVPTSELILGPDGRPVRGVGTGAFALPADLAGGQYNLVVTELPLPGSASPPTKLAEKKIIVNNYTPPTLEKQLEFDARTYGPGDTVQARIEVRDQGKPFAEAALRIRVEVDGQEIAPEVAPEKTDAAGTAAVRFTLPSAAEIGYARLSVTVTTRDNRPETLVRSVPLATRRLNIEFFPEGGELVIGVPNRVYFRATTATVPARPADVTGVLTDGVQTICEVKTLTDPDHPGVNQGLGVFTFTPEPGKRYAVRLDRPVGVIQLAEPFAAPLGSAAALSLPAYQLPAAKADGVVLHVPDGVTGPGEKLRVRLWSGRRKRTVLVGAYARGRPVAHQRAILEPGKPTELTLDSGASRLGGVTRVTVFEEPADEEGRVDLKPVAERLVYRRLGEAMKLRFDATRPGGRPRGGAFAPGEPVELTIHAYDEDGRPKPAILWASVVNQSVIVAADEKSDRLLPTHFLLSGEVENGSDLEHADFLLTDHPRAAEGLDLLLGTQGWRRFAEQAPEEFRARHGGRADALLVAMGRTTSGIPPSWRSDTQRLFDEFWPKYEAAILELDRAEKVWRNGSSTAELRDELTRAESAYTNRLTSFGNTAADLQYFDNSIQARRPWMPLTLALAFGLGLAMLTARFVLSSNRPERGPLTVGAVGFLFLGLFVLLVAWATGLGDQDWRTYASQIKSSEASVGQAIPGGADRVAKDAHPTPDPGNVAEATAQLPGHGAAMQRGHLIDDVQAQPMVAAAGLPDPEPDRAVPNLAKSPIPPAALDPVSPPQPLGARLMADVQTIRHRAQEAGRPLNEVEAAALNRIQSSAPLTPPLVVREYAHRRSPSSVGPEETRTDFTETLLWQPVIVLPDDGRATLRFDLSDAVAGYRVLVAGHTLDGRLGAVTGTLEVRKPLAADPKLPQEVSSADKIDMSVGLTNSTEAERTAGVVLSLDGLSAEDSDKFAVSLPPNGGGRRLIRLMPNRVEGELAVTVNATAGPGLTDSVRRTVRVVPDGFPHQGAKSDLLEEQTEARVNLPEWLPGTLAVTVTVYPNTLSELQAGLDGLMREPHGCFEQSSTANYPNVLIASYLRETGTANPELSRRARELMEKGYVRLTGYECPRTGSPTRLGYEWFGAADRPHEALTAYGLLQFTDMSRVYPVDAAMLTRTRQFLIDSRDGRGGFTRNAQALDSFGRAPEHITNAYIVWAVTEADRTAADPADLTREIDALFALAKEGERAKDPYFLALVANALLNRGRQAEGVAMLNTVAGMQADDGSVPGAATSITSSSGRALLIETTALAVLGWLKANRPEQFVGNVQRAMKWVGAQRDASGTFGSTQSTILALKSLIAYARANGPGVESGQLKVYVGGQPVTVRDFSSTEAGPVEITIADAEERFKPGETVVRLETTARKPYPMSVAWSCRTTQPDSSPECGVRLATKLARTRVEEGDAVRLAVTVENVRDTPHGMVVAVVGLPAGLKLPEDMKQLNDLTAAPAPGAEPVVSYWETRGRELILYWRGMTPRQKVTLGVDLVADVPGEYRGPANRTYLYYDADHKHWAAPLAVTVRAKDEQSPQR
jgi:hypothetical protein